jgi:hypothetical protein
MKLVNLMVQGMISVRKHVARILTLVQVPRPAPYFHIFLLTPSSARSISWAPLIPASSSASAPSMTSTRGASALPHNTRASGIAHPSRVRT